MRILLLGNHPPPFGGVPRHIITYATWLAENGNSVWVLSGGRDKRFEQPAQYSVVRLSYFRFAICLALGLICLKKPPVSILFRAPVRWCRYIAYAREAISLCDKHDVEFIVSYNIGLNGPVAELVFETRGIEFGQCVLGEIFTFKPILSSREYFRRVVRSAKFVFSCSSFCAKTANIIDASASPVGVNFGVSIEHFVSSRSRNEVAYGVDGSAPTCLLFMGRLCRELGVDSFMAMVDELAERGFEFYVVIAGAEGDLTNAVKDWLSIKSSVRKFFYPNISLEDQLAVYELADVIVVPSRGERTCGSLALMEACGFGVPAVAFDVGGISELLDDGLSGFLAPAEDLGSLVNHVINFLENPDLIYAARTYCLDVKRLEFDEKLCFETIQKLITAS